MIKVEDIKKINITKPIDQIEFINITLNAWKYVTGITIGGKPTFPDHLEQGGVLEMKPNYEITGMGYILKGNWSFYVKNAYYSNIRCLITEKGGYKVRRLEVKHRFSSKPTTFFEPPYSSTCQYDFMTEFSQYDGLGFDIAIDTEWCTSIMYWEDFYGMCALNKEKIRPYNLLLPI